MNRLAQKKKVCALIPARLNSVRFREGIETD